MHGALDMALNGALNGALNRALNGALRRVPQGALGGASRRRRGPNRPHRGLPRWFDDRFGSRGRGLRGSGRVVGPLAGHQTGERIGKSAWRRWRLSAVRSE
ncbi:hypothetical protein GCM10010185_03860 [Saccharothrix coeruleofusca]|uniref:Uncharacterized protein n=1 Tax=Saccharothrix coeruleofusca TaxID=33919 RepID=A0A918AH59_9PSEU|nr:hypothetical protein GCM10010185_03860 [Saccharothrix coeruleofusca]